MKPILLITLFLQTFRLIAQPIFEDQTKARWIYVDRTTENSFLFDYVKVKKEAFDSTLMNFFESASKQKESVFFLEYASIEYKEKLYVSIIQTNNPDTLGLDECKSDISSNAYLNDVNSFYVVIDSQRNQADENGDPILYHCGGGMECYSYPPKTMFQFFKEKSQSINVREELIIDKATNAERYKPVAISVYPSYINSTFYTLWIDLEKIKPLLSYPYPEWYNYFVNQSYHGVQYMQKGIKK